MSRRHAVAALATTSLVLAVPVAVAQEATPGGLPTGVAEWIAGWQTLDADRIAAIYEEDAVHELVATGQRIAGREAIRANIAALMAAIPDTTLSVNQAFATPTAGAVDWNYAGHYTEPYPGFPPPAGQALAFRATTLFTLQGDLVVRTSEFYDLYGLFVQLGLLPAQEGEATPKATPT
jgi:steroid delta-isomerase-like uncharacterized protein